MRLELYIIDNDLLSQKALYIDIVKYWEEICKNVYSIFIDALLPLIYLGLGAFPSSTQYPGGELPPGSNLGAQQR